MAPVNTGRTSRAFRHPCPRCGGEILSVHMPNGGWAHFEGGAGLSKVKHPCFDLGAGLGRQRDELTQDLFGDEPARS